MNAFGVRMRRNVWIRMRILQHSHMASAWNGQLIRINAVHQVLGHHNVLFIKRVRNAGTIQVSFSGILLAKGASYSNFPELLRKCSEIFEFPTFP